MGANCPKPRTSNDCTEQAEWRGLRFYVYSIEYAYMSVLTQLSVWGEKRILGASKTKQEKNESRLVQN